MRRLVLWAALGLATVAIGWSLGALGLPSAYLFSALLAGLAAALLAPGELAVPDAAFGGAQAVTGVVLGAFLNSDSLSAVAGSWLPVTLVSAGTLGLSLLAGRLLARMTEADEPTSSLGLIAGGASGIVAMADELGADGRLVAFMQYARVLVVVLVTPVVAALAFPGHSSGGVGGVTSTPIIGEGSWWAITLGASAVGAVGGRIVRLPGATLLGPLVVAGTITLLAPANTFHVPALLREIAFAVIGAQVGLRFTTDTLRAVGRLLLPVTVAITGLIVGCLGLALVLYVATPVSLADSYLATTPGGLIAVAAVAVGAGGDTTFIVAVQGLRLVVMVVLAPLVVRRMIDRHAGRATIRN